MSRNNFITNSFVAGQVSPKFFGRTETSQYNQSCELVQDAIVHPQGGVSRRTGTIFKREVVASDATPLSDGKVIPFYTTDGQRIPLVITPTFGNATTIKTWQGSATEFVRLDPDWLGTVADARSQLVLSLYNNVQIDLNRLQYAQSADVMFFAYEGVPPFEIRYIATNASGSKFVFRPTVNTIGFYLGVSNIEDIANAWRAMPFMPPVVGKAGYGLRVTSVGGPVTMTVNPSSPKITIDSTWLNKVIKFTHMTSAYVFWVTAVAGSTATLTPFGGNFFPAATTYTFGDLTNTDDFYEDGYWDGIKGYPRTVSLFEGRLIFGGTRTFPDMLFFSRVNNVYRFDQRRLVTDADYVSPIVTTDPFTTTLKATGKVNEIRWMMAGKTITVGTNFGEFIVQGPSQAKTIGIDNIGSSTDTSHGSSEAQAIRVENATVFLARTKRNLREIAYAFDEASYKAANLNLLADDIATKNVTEVNVNDNEGYILEMAAQEAPLGLVWCKDTNGRLSCMTRERSQDVIAWHSHKIAGTTSLSIFNAIFNTWSHPTYAPFVKSICTMQRATDAQHYVGEPDDLYMLVLRGINKGGPLPFFDDALGKNYEQRLYLEVLAQEWTKPSIVSGWDVDNGIAPVYMDFTYMTRSALLSSPGVVGPLPHGVGDKVVAIADGRYLGEFTVGTDRKINITSALGGDTVYNIIVGYNFSAFLVPVTPEVPATTGSSQGMLRRIDSLVLYFYRAIGCKFGRVVDDQQAGTPQYLPEEVIFNYKTTTDGNPPHVPLFTGNKKVTFPLGTELRPRVVVESHLPFPMHVTHMVAKMTVSEG